VDAGGDKPDAFSSRFFVGVLTRVFRQNALNLLHLRRTISPATIQRKDDEVDDSTKKIVNVAVTDFLNSIGMYNRKKVKTGLVELLEKGKEKFEKMIGSGRSMPFVIADANNALRKSSSSSNVTVTEDDMIEALGGEQEVARIIREGEERRAAARAKRKPKKVNPPIPPRPSNGAT
jgi:hypothetical protein